MEKEVKKEILSKSAKTTRASKNVAMKKINIMQTKRKYEKKIYDEQAPKME